MWTLGFGITPGSFWARNWLIITKKEKKTNPLWIVWTAAGCSRDERAHPRWVTDSRRGTEFSSTASTHSDERLWAPAALNTGPHRADEEEVEAERPRRSRLILFILNTHAVYHGKTTESPEDRADDTEEKRGRCLQDVAESTPWVLWFFLFYLIFFFMNFNVDTCQKSGQNNFDTRRKQRFHCDTFHYMCYC